MIVIKRAESLDLPEIQKLATSIWSEHYVPIIGLEQVEYMLEKFQSIEAMNSQIIEGYRYYCLILKGELIGYFSVKTDYLRSELFLSKFYIVKSQRGKGFGKEVISYLKQYILNNGLIGIRLTVNKFNVGSIKAYKRFGFKISKEVVFEIGQEFVMDDYEMIYYESV